MRLLLRTLKNITTRPKAANAPQPGPGTPAEEPRRRALEARSVDFDGVPLLFSTPNDVTAWRVASFFEKEPDTVAWLRGFPEGSVFLDIGANVGMYSLAAASRGCRVFAFEPEAHNYALLNTNIALNKRSEQIIAYCAALSDKSGYDRLYLSLFDPTGGGSCHSFGEEVGFDLAPRPSPFAQGCIGVTLDELIANNVLPVPDYIKIDVDGFEHKVIAGSRQTLSNPKLKEMLIEINPALPEHRDLILELRELGFHYDQDQQRGAARKSGDFEGVGEIIFRRVPPSALTVLFDTKPQMVDAGEGVEQDTAFVQEHVLERIGGASIVEQPFPYMVVDNLFPKAYYEEALARFPLDSQMIPLSETGRSDYKDRLVTLFTDEHFARLDPERRNFWAGFSNWLYSEQFINAVARKFWPFVACRLSGLSQHVGGVRVHGDALIVSDKSNYEIGPHTDAAHRLITFLFYMPQDDSTADLGTSIYEPRDPDMVVNPKQHYHPGLFNRLETIPFLPNRGLIFVRTDRSFHGVARITRENPERHLVINNIRIA